MDPETYLQFLLTQMGERNDTAYTAVLAKQLQFVKAQTYDILYPTMKAKQLLPVSHDIDPGAQTWSYEQWDSFGMATIISNYAADLPLVDVIADDFIYRIHSIGDAYQYSIQDLAADNYSGRGIGTRKANAARDAIERRFEQYGASGNLVAGLAGLLNHPNVALVSPATGTWSTATALQMLDDMNTLVNGVLTNSQETVVVDTFVLDPASYRRIAVEPMLDNSGRTVLETFLNTSPYIKTVESWIRCATADAAGTGPRFVCYQKNPGVITYEIPREFTQMPPQAVNLAFKVNCHARVAGVAIYYPLGVGYMDGC